MALVDEGAHAALDDRDATGREARVVGRVAAELEGRGVAVIASAVPVTGSVAAFMSMAGMSAAGALHDRGREGRQGVERRGRDDPGRRGR